MTDSENARILNILRENARTPLDQIAKRLGLTVEDVARRIDAMEKDRTIMAYQAVLNPAQVEEDVVMGIIEVKLTPQRGTGFDTIAQRIYKFPEVKTCYLLSGAHDLHVVVEGRSLNEVAAFVSERLATIDHVASTATHFILKKYKDFGVVMQELDQAERLAVSP